MSHYETLGVQASATSEEIEKAYRKLAIQYHPDMNPGDTEVVEKFKTIADAYEILRDPEKKARYDGASNSPINDLFQSLFQTNHLIKIKLTLEEVFLGCNKTIQIEKKAPCKKCDNGFVEFQDCPCVKPPGFNNTPKRNGICQFCLGTKKVGTKYCSECEQGVVDDGYEEINIKIPAGVQNGAMFKIPNKGQFGTKNSKSDLLVKIAILPHPVFERRDNDLFVVKNITYSQFILGTEIDIDLFGTILKVKVPAKSNVGMQICCRSQGLAGGNLLIGLGLRMPNITKEYEDKVRELQELES